MLFWFCFVHRSKQCHDTHIIPFLSVGPTSNGFFCVCRRWYKAARQRLPHTHTKKTPIACYLCLWHGQRNITPRVHFRTGPSERHHTHEYTTSGFLKVDARTIISSPRCTNITHIRNLHNNIHSSWEWYRMSRHVKTGLIVSYCRLKWEPCFSYAQFFPLSFSLSFRSFHIVCALVLMKANLTLIIISHVSEITLWNVNVHACCTWWPMLCGLEAAGGWRMSRDMSQGAHESCDEDWRCGYGGQSTVSDRVVLARRPHRINVFNRQHRRASNYKLLRPFNAFVSNKYGDAPALAPYYARPCSQVSIQIPKWRLVWSATTIK